MSSGAYFAGEFDTAILFHCHILTSVVSIFCVYKAAPRAIFPAPGDQNKFRAQNKL